jgi:hypothetical protein
MPDAAAADRTSLFRAAESSVTGIMRGTLIANAPSLSLMVLKSLMKMLAQQHAT